MSHAWIETFTGKAFDILNPTREMICIEDIAHSGSQVNRFTGHAKFPYPVTQHSRLGSYLFSDRHLALKFLLHDGSESYLGDMNRPLKHYTVAGDEYRKVEHPIQMLIYEIFCQDSFEPPEIKIVDNQMLALERSVLMFGRDWGNSCGTDWSKIEKPDIQIVETSFHDNKRLFLERFYELTEGTANEVSLYNRCVA